MTLGKDFSTKYRGLKMETQQSIPWFYLGVSWLVSVSVLFLWGWLSLTSLIMAQITLMAVTVYLHRSQAHPLVKLHPAVSHFFRFWLWLTTGMTTPEWTSVHRKHHQKQDTKEDPHTPVFVRRQFMNQFGMLLGNLFWFVRQVILWGGVRDYKRAIREGGPELLQKYGQGTPNDWLERNVYSQKVIRHLGVFLFLPVALLYAFGWPEALMLWLVQMGVVPFLAAGVINGVGHAWGYRNYDTDDQSRNIYPVDILIAGEGLHNNHHGDARDVNLARRPGEVDSGYWFIRLLELCDLATTRKAVA